MATAPAKQGYARPFAEMVFSPWLLLPLAAVLGAFFAYQFFGITSRYVKLLFAAIVLLGLVRFPFHAAVAVFLIIWVAPTYVFLGDSNVIFIGVFAVIWIIRRQLGNLPRRERTPLDWAIAFYLCCHLVSFVNVHDEFSLRGARDVMMFTISGCLFYLLVVDGIRTERHLQLALSTFCVTAAFVDITAVSDYVFGYRLIPAWFIFAPATLLGVVEGGRAGGVFGFHGLLADFSAMSCYLQLVLGMRATSRAAKAWFYGLAAANIPIILITGNRGGAIIWLVGGLYFTWFNRKRIRWSLVFLIAPGLVAVTAGIRIVRDRILSRSVLLTRLADTQIQHGIPEDRTEVWARVMSHIPEHPWIGHGPFIDLRRGAASGMYWPHSGYLFYLYTIGVVGLLSFLWILGKMLLITFPFGGVDFRRDSLGRATMAVFHIQILMFALSQLRDEHQRGNVYYYYMWILFALASIGWRMVRAEKHAARAVGGPAFPRIPPAESTPGRLPFRAGVAAGSCRSGRKLVG